MSRKVRFLVILFCVCDDIVFTLCTVHFSNDSVPFICFRHEDITSILHRVNNDVSQKEASRIPGAAKQISEIRSTLRKRLVLGQMAP